MKAIEPVRAENVVLGQYLGSEDGTQPGYKDGKRFVWILRSDPQELWNINPHLLSCCLFSWRRSWFCIEGPWVLRKWGSSVLLVPPPSRLCCR